MGSSWFPKSVTLVARDKYHDIDPTQLSRKTFTALGREATYYKFLEILKNVAVEDGYLSHVNKKLVINTGVTELDFDNYGKPKYCRKLRSKHNAPEMLQELSMAIDGEVEVDGTLCFRSGTLVDNIFMVHDNHVVLWKKDLDMWRASRAAMKLFATSEEEKEIGYWLRKMTEDESVRLKLVHRFRRHNDRTAKASRFTPFSSYHLLLLQPTRGKCWKMLRSHAMMERTKI